MFSNFMQNQGGIYNPGFQQMQNMAPNIPSPMQHAGGGMAAPSVISQPQKQGGFFQNMLSSPQQLQTGINIGNKLYGGISDFLSSSGPNVAQQMMPNGPTSAASSFLSPGNGIFSGAAANGTAGLGGFGVPSLASGLAGASAAPEAATAAAPALASMAAPEAATAAAPALASMAAPAAATAAAGASTLPIWLAALL